MCWVGEWMKDCFQYNTLIITAMFRFRRSRPSVPHGANFLYSAFDDLIDEHCQMFLVYICVCQCVYMCVWDYLLHLMSAVNVGLTVARLECRWVCVPSPAITLCRCCRSAIANVSCSRHVSCFRYTSSSGVRTMISSSLVALTAPSMSGRWKLVTVTVTPCNPDPEFMTLQLNVRSIFHQ